MIFEIASGLPNAMVDFQFSQTPNLSSPPRTNNSTIWRWTPCHQIWKKNPTIHLSADRKLTASCYRLKHGFRFLLPVELHGFHEIAYPSLETKELPQTHALCDVKLKAIIAASRHELFVVEYPTPPDSSTGYLATQALQALLDKRSEATRDYGFIHNLCALITRITTRIIFGYWQFTTKNWCRSRFSSYALFN